MTAALLPLAFALAFISVVVLVQMIAAAVLDRQDRTKRLNRRLALYDAGLTRQQVYRRLVPAAARGVEARLTRRIQGRVQRALQLAGVTLPLTRFWLILGSVAGVLWLVSLIISTRGGAAPLGPNILLSLPASILVTALCAWLWLARRTRVRLRKIELQLPVALDVMTRALRAGHPVVSAIQLAAEEMGDPLGSEFGLVIDETTYGVELQEALVNFAERTGSEDAHYLAVSVAVQIETGGNLSDVLDSLAAVIRGRNSLTLKVKALSSEGRTSALLLTALPALAVGIQLLFQPKIYTDKFSDPIFWPAVAGTMALYLLGWLWIQRIINFKY